MTTKLTKVPIKKQVPRNDREHETAIEKAYQQGRDELEKEYASGSSFIRAGEHIYVHTRFSDRLEKEAYQRGMSDAPKTRYGEGMIEGIRHESKKKTLYRAQGALFGSCLTGIIIIIITLTV